MNGERLIEYWSRVEENIHPEDKPYLTSAFMTYLRPVPWAGPLLSADIFVLFLNPGYDSGEGKVEGRPEIAQRLVANLKGTSPYFYLLPEFKEHPGYDWARATFGKDIVGNALERICVLQLVAYHSTVGQEARRLAVTLPSSQAIKDFVRNSLMPRVRAGEAGVVVARSSRLWGFQDSDDLPHLVVYKGGECRRGYQTTNTSGGHLIRKRLGMALGKATAPQSLG